MGCHRGVVTGSNTKMKQCSLLVRSIAGGQYDWRAPNRIPAIQTSANANEAKVFKAHAAPLGLCDNLVNALKLLANQHEDGDSPRKSIVTGLHLRSCKGIMDGLRSFIEVDNRSAVDVGGLRRGSKSIQVKKPHFSEAFPEAVIREGVRCEPSSTRHILSSRGGKRRWQMRTGTPSTRPITKEMRDKNGKRCLIYLYRELHQATGVKSLVTVKRQRPSGQ